MLGYNREVVKNPEIKEKIDSAHTLLLTETTTFEKFESIRKIVYGVNPRIDKQLSVVSKAFSAYSKLHAGEIIELSAQHLPAQTEKEKKRKKALLFLIQSWSQLKNEVERVRQELQIQGHEQSGANQVLQWAKIIKYAKGPFGLITLAALIIVGISVVSQTKQTTPSTQVHKTVIESTVTNKEKMEVITFNGKKIPLKQFHIGHGPDCGGGNIPHYHALDSVSVTSVDGTVIPDPGACGYGKVSEVRIEEF
jgi:hypothetical protein